MKARIQTHKKRSNRGFTLIEMMIVVAIIAVIAGVIAINFMNAKGKAQVAATQGNLKQIGTAMELYYGDNQAYPASGNVTNTLPGTKYLNNTPTSPGPGGAKYVYTSAGTEYTIEDPATYDVNSLLTLNQATVASGVATSTAAKCTACTHVGFSNTVGLFGY
jgi:general secretion pathway protein G